MTNIISIAPEGLSRWVTMSAPGAPPAGIEQRCTRDYLQKAIAHLGDVEVVTASIITAGQYEMPRPPYDLPGIPLPERLMVGDLPHFCDVQVHVRGPGGHVARVMVWVPLHWNGRFLGSVGGGNRTESLLLMPEFLRTLTLPAALRNGFATAQTDGANRDRRHSEWGLVEERGELDWELIRNCAHRSTHEMTVIGKAVTAAIHGRAPKYSYIAGCSGGGRQALMEAQRYPEDYDGIWSSDPAINWTRFTPADLWPALVMKELGVLPPAKLEAFRAAAIEACDGLDGLRDGIIGAFDPCDFDPKKLIGRATAAGTITATDVEVMTKIWEGPRTRNGDFLWYGVRPGTESWGNNFAATGVCLTGEVDGRLEPKPFDIPIAYLRAWVLKDLTWDWRSLTFEQFEALFERSVREFAEIATDDPYLFAFRARGGKLIISHGANDQVIPASGSVDYYRRVIEAIGSEEDTKTFARLFITEGDGHGTSLNPGPGVTLADAMTALMKWVEEDQVPDQIIAKEINHGTGAVLATRPVYAYPMVPQYRGQGNPQEASSFNPVHFSERAKLVRR